EDLVLGEDVIADERLLEQPPLRQLLLLAEAAQQEEELALERGARAVLVEIVQEGVLDLLVDAGGLEPLRQQFHEAGLADTDRAFDRDELEIHGPARREPRIITASGPAPEGRRARRASDPGRRPAARRPSSRARGAGRRGRSRPEGPGRSA